MPASFDHNDEGEILLHIGPHKTGTTGIQQAALRAQVALQRLGRIYLHDEGREQLNTSSMEFLRLSGERRFQGETKSLTSSQLSHIIHSAARGKLILSSEHFCRYQEFQIKDLHQLLREVRPGQRVKVLVTLRPIAKIIPGQWQQFVRAQVMPPFEDWVALVLSEQPSDAFGRAFRQRHAHDKLILRWSAEFGVDNVSVIVANDQHPEFLYRSFEEIIGVPKDTLAMRRVANESLTLQEAEVVRAAHDAMHRAGMFDGSQSSRGMAIESDPSRLLYEDERKKIGWPYDRISKGLITDRSYREGEKVVLHGEAQRKVAAWSRTIVDGIKASGVHVMGDLESLVSLPEATDARSSGSSSVMVTPRLAGELVLSALQAVGVGDQNVEARVLRKIPTSKLIRHLLKRALPKWLRIRVADRPR